MHIQPMLDTEEERRITPDGAVYEIGGRALACADN